MICKPEDAKNYRCCAMDKPCDGDRCMAWRDEFAEDKAAPKMLLEPFPLKNTGRGYCGLAR